MNQIYYFIHSIQCINFINFDIKTLILMIKQYDVQILLQNKYSNCECYYYSRTLNDFVNSARTQEVIEFYQTLAFNDNQEFLRRFYIASELHDKIRLFTEYYKYHNEIPRYFMHKISSIMSNYHDKKRRVEYNRIKRIIEEENRRNPNKPKKAIVGDQKEELQLVSPKHQEQVYSKVLQDIIDNSTTIEAINQKLDAIQINVGELILQPSNREQEQLQNFIHYLAEKQKPKFQTHYQLHSPKTFNKITFKVSQQTIKQMISRTSKNQQQFHLSPKTLKDEQLVSPNGQSTHRQVKDPLSKLLSPVHVHTMNYPLIHHTVELKQKPTIQTHRSQQASVSLSKQFKIADNQPQTRRLHQHTRSEFRFFKK
ncbi:unnamed protein product [Paramecium octaurelia]|uniref:Uncharacterized protein n=1 Tax=Paramecium octaurelia TaxID=43137 RepID=A0A8S1XN67_PAROT|nr:unnamed protein product [Paramecium octaurelia]